MKKQKRKTLKEKQAFSQTDNPDSIWQRSNSTRKYQGHTKSKDGAAIMQKLGINDPGGGSKLNDVKPIKLMDMVFDTWGLDTDEESEHE